MGAEGKEEEYEGERERGAEKTFEETVSEIFLFSDLLFSDFLNFFQNFHLTLSNNVHPCTNIPYLLILYVHLSLQVPVKFIIAILKPSLAKFNISVTSEFIFIDCLLKKLSVTRFCFFACLVIIDGILDIVNDCFAILQ